MIGHNFSKYDPNQDKKSSFEKLLDAFMQLLTYTSGDVAEALSWLTELDKEYDLTNEEYGIGDFIEDLPLCWYDMVLPVNREDLLTQLSRHHYQKLQYPKCP